jgi:hypothetical protein
MSVDIFADSTAPTQSVHQAAASQPGPKVNWIVIVLACALAWMFMSNQGCSPIPGPSPDDDSIVIDEAGKFAMILQDKSESGQKALTKGQRNVLTSMISDEAAEAAGFAFRRVDVNDKLETAEPIWQKIRDNAAAAPSLTTLNDGRLVTGPLPETHDDFKSALETER